MTNITDIERLFKTHYAQLHQLAKVLLHDDDLARDMVHDVFTSMLSAESLDCVSVGYIIAAVRNRCLNHLRDSDLRQRLTNFYFADVDTYDTEQWPDEATIARIYDIIASELTPACRRVMEMRFVEGMTFVTIAAELGVSETAVYKHVRQALVIIRKNLKQHEQ